MAQEPAMERGSSKAEAEAATTAPRPRLAGKWQIPLLALSIFCFTAALLYAVLKHPSEEVSPTTLAQQAEAALATGDFVHADEACEKFLVTCPQHELAGRIQEIQGDANFALGVRTFRQPQDYLNKAARAYRSANSLTPGGLPSPSILVKLGRTFQRLEDHEKAVEFYDQALQSAPVDPFMVHMAKIDALRNTRQAEQLTAALGEVDKIRQAMPDLAPDRRTSLALQEAGILNEQGNYVAAEKKLRTLLESNPDQVSSGMFLIELARTQRLAGQKTLALDTLQKVISEPAPHSSDTEVLRGQAFLLTARTFAEMANYDKALYWFKRTVSEYPEADEALAARLGIAETYLQLGELDAASNAYAAVTPEIRKLPPGGNRWIDIKAAKLALQVQSEWNTTKGHYRDALRFVMLEESILANPDRDVRLRRASILRRLAQVTGQEAEAVRGDQEKWQAKRLETERAWREAGDAYLYVAEQFDGTTQKEYPDDIYEAAQCYQAAGAHQQATDVLRKFIKEVPLDSRVPLARLDLARQYEVTGKWNEAIETLQSLERTSANTLAAFEGTHLLGKAYVRKGPEFYGQAEEAFLSLVESAQVDPQSLWYRKSLLELSRLLHRRGQYDRAIMRLSEYIQRYSDGQDALSARYLLASSLRSQGLAALAKSRDEVRLHEKESLKRIHREKLQSAIEDYRRLVELYERQSVQLDPLRQQEYRNVMFELADSLFDLGLTEEARQAYNLIVYRFENLPAVMPAYVQLAAIYQGLGERDQLSAVLERAKWTLEKIPDQKFLEQVGGPTKGYWQDWIRKVQM